MSFIVPCLSDCDKKHFPRRKKFFIFVKLKSLTSFYRRFYHRRCELRIALGILQLLRAIYKFYGTQTPKLCPSCTTVRKLRATFGCNFGIIVPRKMKIAFCIYFDWKIQKDNQRQLCGSSLDAGEEEICKVMVRDPLLPFRSLSPPVLRKQSRDALLRL